MRRIAVRLFFQRSCWPLPLLALLAVAASAFAQPAGETSPPTAPRINLLEPDTFILEDADGNRQTVLNFSYQAFVEARRALQKIEGPQQPPPFSIQETRLTGAQHDGFASILVDFNIAIEGTNWVRVPLGMPRAAMAKAADYTGKGKFVLDYDREAGHVAWLLADKTATEGKPSEKGAAEPSMHRLKFDIRVPVAKQGDESSVKVQLPGSVRSTFQIDVQTRNALGRVRSNAQLEQTEVGPAGNTRFSGFGNSGQFELSWHAIDRPAAKLPTALEADGEILVIVKGPNVRSEARLQVRSFGGEFDRFQVRLPPRAALVESNQTGYAISAIEDPAMNPAARQRGVLVEVKLGEKSQEAPAIRLVTERSIDTSNQSGSVELAGFEVVDAVRQWGFIATKVLDDWQPLWGESRNVRRVEELPATLKRDELSEAFEYFSQPFSLPVRIVPRATRIRVRPEYTLEVGQQQATLEGKLHYSIRGAKVFDFRIRIPNWQNVEIGPAEIVDRNNIVEDGDHVYIVPLKRPSTEPHVLELKASVPISDVTQGTVQFEFPEPAATFYEPATVVVQPDDNVEISIREKDVVGLVPQHVAPSIVLPAKQQDPVYFRGVGDKMQLAASLQFNEQTIDVDVDSHVLVSAEHAQVEQRFVYRVMYEPVDRLDLLLPQSMANEEIEVHLDSQLLTLKRVTAADQPLSPAGQITMRALLPTPARIGEVALSLRYVVRRTPLQPSRSERWNVPLLMPRDGGMKANRLKLEAEDSVRALLNPQADSPVWKPSPSASGTDSASYFVAQDRTPHVPLALQLEQAKRGGSTDVRQAWLQTWLTDTARQDRIAFQVLTDRPELRVKLPAGIGPAETEVFLDGVLRPSIADADGNLIVEIASRAGPREHRLELRYQFKQRPAGPVALAAPKLLNANWMGVAYWHLVLPIREHIVSEPLGFSPQYRWKWQDFYFGQQAAVDQPQLKQWTETQVPTTANFYLFSSLGLPGELKVSTASQTSIVLTASGLVLVTLLALFYLPARFRLGLAIALSVILGIAGQSNPAPAILAVQAAALGIGVFFFAVALRRLLSRPLVTSSKGSGSSLTIRPRSLDPYFVNEGSGVEATSTVALEPSEP